MLFIYDGSLEGLMCVIFTAYETGIEPAGIYPSHKEYQTSMLYESKYISTDMQKAARVATGIKRISYAAYADVLLAFRHMISEKDMVIYKFLRLLFDKKADALKMLNHPDVIKFNLFVSQVNHEIHRLHGFLRFRETAQGVFYAPISPDHYILDLLAPHFMNRYKGMPFCIHDVSRSKMLVCDGYSTRLIAAGEVEIELTEREMLMQLIWKDYYNSVNIEQRANPRLQRQFLPTRYRKFMTEFKNDISKSHI